MNYVTASEKYRAIVSIILGVLKSKQTVNHVSFLYKKRYLDVSLIL